MEGMIFWRGKHSEAQYASEVGGDRAAIEAALRQHPGPGCGCCRSAFRSGIFDADMDETGRVSWSISPAFADENGMGYFRHSVIPWDEAS